MSQFLVEMRNEVQARLTQYRREKDELAKAAQRMGELAALIKEAEAELLSIERRLPKPSENNDADKAKPQRS